MRNKNTYRLACMGLLTAIAYGLCWLGFSLFADFLKLEFASVPILFSSFLFGPWWTLLVALVKAILHGITISGTGIWGILMDFISTAALVIVSGLIYRKHHTRRGAVAGLGFGGLAMLALMIPLNLLITPIYTGAPVEAVVGMLLPILIPFNLVKIVANGVLTFFLYKPLSRFLKFEKWQGKPQKQ